MKETLFKDGRKVEIERDVATGTVTREVWSKDGWRDRADGPAVIIRDATTGILTREGWYRDGKLHRTDGPAFIERDATTGTVTRETWWIDGLPVNLPRPREASTTDES